MRRHPRIPVEACSSQAYQLSLKVTIIQFYQKCAEVSSSTIQIKPAVLSDEEINMKTILFFFLFLAICIDAGILSTTIVQHDYF